MSTPPGGDAGTSNAAPLPDTDTNRARRASTERVASGSGDEVVDLGTAALGAVGAGEAEEVLEHPAADGGSGAWDAGHASRLKAW